MNAQNWPQSHEAHYDFIFSIPHTGNPAWRQYQELVKYLGPFKISEDTRQEIGEVMEAE